MDSLRYWVTEMHVDGFRFDLAPTLARDREHVDKLSAFFDIIHQDPVLSRMKLIAEPWDLGDGGYQVGNFPVLWSEWNGRYRDTVRRFWLGDRSKVGDLGYRLTGSSDLYGDDGRRPHASINFVAAHDGFTLRDLVSYEQKHNEANGEDNADGWDDNASMNFGVEGETTDPEILRARARQQRSFLATLLFSQGVPMICAGDEMGRTQRGNNNAYVPGQPGLVDRLGPRRAAARAPLVHAKARGDATRAPFVPQALFPERGADRADRNEGRDLDSPPPRGGGEQRVLERREHRNSGDVRGRLGASDVGSPRAPALWRSPRDGGRSVRTATPRRYLSAPGQCRA